MALAVVAAACLTATFSSPSRAHSSMTTPTSMSHTTDCRVGGPPGKHRNCPGPCPNVMLRSTGLGSSPASPAATYARGQRVLLRWARNNHEGGFVRWALVPLTQMGDPAAHQRFAFHWGCWSAGRFRCTDKNRRRLCVDDRLNQRWGTAYSGRVVIPAVVPDGNYVLSFVSRKEGEGGVVRRARGEGVCGEVWWASARPDAAVLGVPQGDIGRVFG